MNRRTKTMIPTVIVILYLAKKRNQRGPAPLTMGLPEILMRTKNQAKVTGKESQSSLG